MELQLGRLPLIAGMKLLSLASEIYALRINDRRLNSPMQKVSLGLSSFTTVAYTRSSFASCST